MKKLKLTQEGLEKLTRELESKKEELRELGKYKSQAAANEGDAWHDNFAFEQTEIKERGLIRQINELQERINTAEVIQDEKVKSSDVVGVGSHVTVSLKFSQEDEEELTGNNCPCCNYPTVYEYGLEVCYHCGWSADKEELGYYDE